MSEGRAKDGRDGWLFVMPWAPTAIGGVSRVVNELATSLSSGSTFDPHILVLDWHAQGPSYERTASSTVIRLRVRDRGSPWSRQHVLYWLSLPFVALTLRRILARLRIAVVNVHYPTEQGLELLSTIRWIRPGIRTIVSFHGMDVCSLAQMNAAAKQRWVRELGRATAVTCCSAGLLARLQSSLGAPLGNAAVTHNGASRWSRPLRRESPRPGRSTVLSVGTFHVNKGHDVLVSALALIADEHRDLDLVIVGRSGSALADVAALVRACGLDERVTLKTDVALDDMAAVYEGASIYVSAARFEPFGISILEAGAAGLPVIATDTDGARDILDHGTDSIIVPREDTASMARAIASMATDPSLPERLSRNLRTKVLREYQWDTIARRWEALVAEHAR